MVTSTDVWWSSNPSSAELSRHAADRSALSQAVAGQRPQRRVSVRRWFSAWRSAKLVAADSTNG